MGKRTRETDETLAEPGSAFAAGLVSISNGSEPFTKVPAASDSDPTASQAPAAKITGLDPFLVKAIYPDMRMYCSFPPHKETLAFTSYQEYESHYRNEHTNRCLECRKNFPSAHLLSLHISENHDAFIQVKRDKGERTYACFVETCDKICMTPQKRQMHLIAKHMYPKNFFFGITRYGIDGRRSLLLDERKRSQKGVGHSSESQTDRRSSTASACSESKEHHPQPAREVTPPTATEMPTSEAAEPKNNGMVAETPQPASPEPKLDAGMEDISAAMSALQFVPRGVRFGRGKKAGFAKR
ncbi:hypothetical protein QBC40DRAFT_286808 [Triangularia verruculosa]|uniref:C2H2-type domain-containing protein n=1 Tax=Triangularia verruculosa TaxID=2587418 RepID=A0AAN6XAZ4_9PEZI|nr:hypothetical protein QBC40DRAFT_286808 [Triangularia verruculosa]